MVESNPRLFQPSSLFPAFVCRSAGPGLILLVGVVMLSWTWGKWPDVLIDFGRELYVPWQITEGRVLYRDIAYFNGPLSPYLNALWFKLFGIGLRTLVLCNLSLIVVLTVLLYKLLTLISSRVSATVACCVFLMMFACTQFGWCGNLNFVCPYSHEITHGLVLSVASAYSLFSYLRSRRERWLSCAGVCLGLVFLTKAELFLAATVAIAVGLGSTLMTESSRARERWRLLGK